MSKVWESLPEDMRKNIESMPAEQQEQIKAKLESMPPDQLKKMMQQMSSMTPEQREAMQKKRENMTPEELAKMSQQQEKQKAMMAKMADMGGKGKRKADNFKVSLKRLFKYMGMNKGKLILVIVSAVLATTASLTAPLILAWALNLFQDKITMGVPLDYVKITRLVFLLGLIYLANMVFSLIQNRTMTSITQSTVHTMRKEVDAKLMKLPFNYFDSKQKGDILSRITNDIDNIGLSMQQSITQVITSVMTITGCIILMFYLSWSITLVCLVFLGAILFVSRKIMARSQGFFREQWQNLGDLNGMVEESFSGMYVVKAFGREDKKIEQFKKSNDELYEVSRKALFTSMIISPSSNLFNNIAYILICGLGAFLHITSGLPLGNISALIQYQKQYSSPVTQMASVLNTLQSAVASAERVFELLDESEEIETSDHYVKIEKLEGAVDFEHLKFGYTPDKILMNDIDVHVKPGQMVAIVGPTGAGKTTLVNLLMRFYETNGGAIKIDGTDTKQITRADLRDIFGMVLQDTWLFSGTIYDNIAYGNKNATKEKVYAAAESAQIEFFFETMPDGYDTMLNEDASNISQGQKQLLTIARAMVADPKILILDEATSSVDTRTELLIQKAMSNLLKGRTSFVIAHRLSTIKDADLILYMENGNIVEQGTHDSLMEKGEKYAELYNSQFAREEEEFDGLILHDFESNMQDNVKDMLEEFGREKGIQVRYLTSDLMKYEKGLARYMEDDNPPVLFKARYGLFQKFDFLLNLLEPLDDTKAASDIMNKGYALISPEGRIVGMPYYYEALGLIYNKTIMAKYFALTDRLTTVNSMKEIKDQKTLIAVCDDVYKHREELGLDGTFPPCAFAQNADEQWKSYMMAMPIYYESKDKNEFPIKNFEYKYSENTKALYDMIFRNSAATPKEFGDVKAPDSIRSFVMGKSAMTFYLQLIRGLYLRRQNPNEEEMKQVVRDDELDVIPMYFGHEGEEKQNLATGHGWVYAVNKKATEKQKQYAKEFLDWTLYSESGKEHMRKMGYMQPFNSKTKEDLPSEELLKKIYDYLHDEKLDNLDFAYRIMPNGPFRNEYSANLLQYAKGEKSWDEVVDSMVTGWKNALAKNEENVRKTFAEILNY